jgi:hypothetical protein
VTPASTQHGKRRIVSTLLVSSEGAHKLVEGSSRSIAVGCPSRCSASRTIPSASGGVPLLVESGQARAPTGGYYAAR